MKTIEECSIHAWRSMPALPTSVGFAASVKLRLTGRMSKKKAPSTKALPVPDAVLRRLAKMAHVPAEQYQFFFDSVCMDVQTAHDRNGLANGDWQIREAQRCCVLLWTSITHSTS